MLVLIGLAIAVFGVVLIVQGVQAKQALYRSLGGLAVVLGLAVSFLASAFVVVPAGNVGVVFNVFGGVQERERGEGFHIVLPFLQQVTLLSVREQSINFEDRDEIPALSREGLQITTEATIRYRIDGTEAAKMFQTRGTTYEADLIMPTVRSAVRSAIANYNAADLISTDRQLLQDEIVQQLGDQLARSNVILLDALLRNIRIPASIAQAIEEKQAAEQQVQVEENRREQSRIAAQRAVIEAEGRRDAAVAQAEGEAQALRLRGSAIREHPEIIQLEVAQKLAPSLQTIMLPSDGNFLLDVRSLMGPQGNP